MPLKYTKLTCVHYEPGDTLGKLLAHVALAPVLLVVFQFAKVYTRREVHEALLLLGLVLEEGVARGLKHLLQHPRPATCAALHLCHSHGMPSSHTSMMFCFAAVASCTAARLLLLRDRRPAGDPGVWQRLLAAAELLAVWAAAGGVATSRVYLGYHSVDQVAAGAGLGLVWGGLWAAAMHGLQPVYSAVAALPLLQQLGVKNTYGCADALALEAAAHMAAASSGSGRAANGDSSRPPGAAGRAKAA